jgi:hypothetical protein
VTSAHILGADAWISVVERSPARECFTASLITHPATAVLVPRFEGSATFVERSVLRHCDP